MFLPDRSTLRALRTVVCDRYDAEQCGAAAVTTPAASASSGKSRLGSAHTEPAHVLCAHSRHGTAIGCAGIILFG
jgi:hypothetical protein